MWHLFIYLTYFKSSITFINKLFLKSYSNFWTGKEIRLALLLVKNLASLLTKIFFLLNWSKINASLHDWKFIDNPYIWNEIPFPYKTCNFNLHSFYIHVSSKKEKIKKKIHLLKCHRIEWTNVRIAINDTIFS